MSRKEIDIKNEKEISSTAKRNDMIVAIIMVLLIVIAASMVLFTELNTSMKQRSRNLPSDEVVKGEKTVTPPIENDLEKTDLEEVAEEIDTTFTYDMKPAYQNADFFEKLDQIDGENIYIAHPITIDTQSPPTLIIFSHGSTQRISNKMDDSYMAQKIRKYGEFFTDSNYIFAASNQHGDNWGNEQSVQDMVKLIKYVKEDYLTNEEINLLGFSMGGLPTWEFVTNYPEDVKKVALLAPTSYYWNYSEDEIKGLSDVDIKIWHGDSDVNVELDVSRNVVAHMKRFGKNVELVVLPGEDHWDVELGHLEDLLLFYQDEK